MRTKQMIAGFLVAAFAMVSMSSTAVAQKGDKLPPIKSTTYKLKNGLTVILHEDKSTPIVTVGTWYHVGSKNEVQGRTGFAHLFEHMMFQGSANVAKGEHFAQVQAAGGTLNASTWTDRTNYFETLPSHELELALWLEADRMASLLPAMNQEKLDNQRDVVKNERRLSVDNQPYGTAEERMQALLAHRAREAHGQLVAERADGAGEAAGLQRIGDLGEAERRLPFTMGAGQAQQHLVAELRHA